MNFAEAKARVVDHVAGSPSLTNLVIEAPLSVCFNRTGLPIGRSIERTQGKRRYWYVGAGCAAMVAAMYLMRAIDEASPPHGVRLFEAFISFKESEAKSDHKGEAKLLRDVVRYPRDFAGRIISGDALKLRRDDELCSAFRVLGLDCGVPAVIML